MQLCSLIAQSGIAFGTSGARGLVSDFTADVCAGFSQSFLLAMQAMPHERRVAIGIDNRPSSLEMAKACAGMAHAMGYQAEFFGVLPTPALAFYALEQQVPAIMVTGSHIPFDRNGLKFYRPDGEISKADEQAILSADVPLMDYALAALETDPRAAQGYIKRYLDAFPPNCLTGMHIGIYEHSSAGRDLYRHLFETLGADVTSLERSDVFVPIDTEAVSEADQAKALAWSKQYRFDAIFSTDGDGDRPLIADENGQWLRGDVLGLLTAKLLGIEALAVPVSCNSAIELSGAFAKVSRTRIGSPYVIEAFAALETEYAQVAGFEANGGFLLATDVTLASGRLAPLPTRDALLPALALFVASRQQPISKLCQQLPQRFTASDRLQQIPTAWSKNWLASFAGDTAGFLAPFGLTTDDVTAVDETDGLRITLQSGDVVHFRPSGNAPELRCYVEAASEVAAKLELSKRLQQLQQVVSATAI